MLQSLIGNWMYRGYAIITSNNNWMYRVYAIIGIGSGVLLIVIIVYALIKLKSRKHKYKRYIAKRMEEKENND